jgi:flagellar protein FlaG
VASETFVSAMMLITGVVAASILIVAVLPVIWGMVGTFSSASAATDKSMRTDFKIVTTYAKWASMTPTSGAFVTVWMKNVGTARVGKSEIESADVYLGKPTDFARAVIVTGQSYSPVGKSANKWNLTMVGDLNGNSIWETGETIQVDAFYVSTPSLSGQSMYFQFTLPSGVSRSLEFTSI